MLAPHLIFSHMLADYVLQTDWLAARKGQFFPREVASWDGLLLHGLVVWLMSLAVLPGYLGTLWPYVTVIALVHTFQDGVKAWATPRLQVHSFIPYALDQMLHLSLILVFQGVWAGRVNPPPPTAETDLMILGASLVAVTRLYEVSWWANWLDMIPYMNRWRLWGYTERIAMFVLSVVDLWWLAPLAVLPRLYAARRQGQPIWNQKRGMAELLLGIAFSVILGSAL